MDESNIIDYKKVYYPGKLVVLANELFNKQKIDFKVRPNNSPIRTKGSLIGKITLRSSSARIAHSV